MIGAFLFCILGFKLDAPTMYYVFCIAYGLVRSAMDWAFIAACMEG